MVVLTPFEITHLSNSQPTQAHLGLVLTPFEITHLSNFMLLTTLYTYVLTPFEITHLSNSFGLTWQAGMSFNTLRNYTPLKRDCVPTK